VQKAVAIASLAKPYSAAEMLEAVDYLFRHAQGDESRPGPARLEIFDPIPPAGPLPFGQEVRL
jgi:hypothetical protein